MTHALLLYFGLLFGSFVTCWRIRRLARRRYFTSWITNYATMFEASLVAFTVGSTFLNRAHFDLFYHWVALVIAFGVIAEREMLDEGRHPVRVGSRGTIETVRPTGFGPRSREDGYGTDPVPRGA